jgi:hypothetical protein
MTHFSMHKTYTMKKLYDLAYQWIEDKQQHGMDEAEAHKLAPVILDFFAFVMKQQEKDHKASLKN